VIVKFETGKIPLSVARPGLANPNQCRTILQIVCRGFGNPRKQFYELPGSDKQI